MKTATRTQQAKRLGAGVMVWTLLLQAAMPVYAVSPGYAGQLSQLPGIYTTPPNPNVMFTLDDSGSMRADMIPDVALDQWVNMAPFSYNNNFYSEGEPRMWGQNSVYRLKWAYYNNALARYLRSPDVNKLYYDPRIQYQPWPDKNNDKLLSAPADPTKVIIATHSPFNTTPYIDPTLIGTGVTTLDEPNTPTNPTVNITTSLTDTSVAAPNNVIWPATYYLYNKTIPVSGLVMPLTQTGLNVAANFNKVEIKPGGTYTKYPARTDCKAATNCTDAEELQNFANWLQFYRNRRLMARGGVAAAFAKQGTNLRVGFSTINTTNVVRKEVREFSGADRVAFFDDLYMHQNEGRTPLLNATEKVGTYFGRAPTNASSPYAEVPGPATASAGTVHSCRRSFHILSTDGYWSDSATGTFSRANNDNFSGQVTPSPVTGAGYNYSNATPPITTDAARPWQGRYTVQPFADTYAGTLSDVTAYYWKTDLQPSLANNVAPSSRDPAFWQHLTTFTIGLGVNGTGNVQVTVGGATSTTVTAAQAAADPFLSDKIGLPWLSTQKLRDRLVDKRYTVNWTDATGSSSANLNKGDDLIHAAMVGRGRYLSATNPTDLANGLASALSEATDQPLDLAGLAADSPQVRAENEVIQGTFSPDKWKGRLYAFKQDPVTGAINSKPTTEGGLVKNDSQIWEASNKMPLPGNRKIYTASIAGSGSFTPTEFLWTNLTATQQTDVGSLDVLNYLRGDGAKEIANGGGFRDRSRYSIGTPGETPGVLGDIVNGAPIKGPDAGGGYENLPPTDPGRATYTAFRTGTTLDKMRNTVFVGANDGMLHAFKLAKEGAETDDSNTGIERFAYIPDAVYSVRTNASGGIDKKLNLLSDPVATHRFIVDGPPQIADAYFGATTATPGWRTILASSNGAGARSIFAIDVTNPDPVAGGFNASKILWEFSDKKDADMGFVLGYPHIVRMANGQWAALFGNGYDSQNGKAALFIVDITNGNLIKKIVVDGGPNNGLSQPNFIVDDKRFVTAAYAGDLKGNLWKFDLTSTNPTTPTWDVARNSAGTPEPLFKATSSAPVGGVQPITVMPEIVFHPTVTDSAIIIFGTGKLFETSDTAATGNVNTASSQSIYGIWDKPLATPTTAFTSFTRTTSSGTPGVDILKLQTLGDAAPPSPNYKLTSSNTVDWTKQRGWVMDLEAANSGERVNLPPQEVRDLLFVVTNTPIVNDPCKSGGSSKIFALDPFTGGYPGYPVFDTNSNGSFDSGDSGNVIIQATGLTTQPIFQVTSGFVPAATSGITTMPYWVFDRGQVSGTGRAGGVSKTGSLGKPDPAAPPPGTCSSGSGSGGSGPIAIKGTAALSDTTVTTFTANSNGKPTTTTSCKSRISWRQLQ